MNLHLDDFCVCGHNCKVHTIDKQLCIRCFNEEINMKNVCRLFKLDNLKYLEQKYNESISK